MKEVKRAYPNIYIKYKICKCLSNYGFGFWLLSFVIGFTLAGIFAKDEADFAWFVLLSICISSIPAYYAIAHNISGISYLDFLRQETMKAYKKREKKEMKWLM